MIKFSRHPDIALSAGEFATGRYKAMYRSNYGDLIKAIALGRLKEWDVLRGLFANDLWFLINYGFGIPDENGWNGEKAHHPFVVRMCKEVEDGPRTDTLDIWARFH